MLNRTLRAGICSVIVGLIAYLFVGSLIVETEASPLRQDSLFWAVHPFGQPGTGIMELASGDVDGDGHLDLVALHGLGGIVVYLNDGAGSLGQGMPVALGTTEPEYISQVEIADMNGDGFLDLVVATNQAIIVSLNTNKGHFSSDQAMRFPIADLPFDRSQQSGELLAIDGVRIGDMDGDARYDIVVQFQSRLRREITGQTEPPVSSTRRYPTGILFNATPPQGTFKIGRSTLLHQDITNSHYLTLARMDHDTSIDIVFSRSTESKVYLNDGNGSFSTTALTSSHPVPSEGSEVLPSPKAVAPGDFDGNGSTDLIISYDIGTSQACTVLFNEGNGQFSQQKQGQFPCDNSTALDMGDIDLDGDLDVVSVSYQGANQIHFNDGKGRFSSEDTNVFESGSGASFTVVLADFNSDGKLDLAVGNYAPHLSAVYINSNVVPFSDSRALSFKENEGRSESLVGDLDNDGQRDTLAIVGHSNILFHRFDTDGHLVSSEYWTPPLAFRPDGGILELTAVLTDVSGDGFVDLIVAGPTVTRNLVMLNDRQGRFEPRVASFGPLSERLIAGDLNNDGFTDLVGVEVRDSTRRIVVYINNGNGFSGATYFVSISGSHEGPGPLALGDLDGDGYADLVVARPLRNTPFTLVSDDMILWNDGHGRFSTSRSYGFGAGSNTTSQFALGDIDGNGTIDIVTGAVGQSYVFLNDGSGGFPSHLASPVGPRTFDVGSLAMGDINGDRSLDMLVLDVHGASTRAFLNDGRGNFVDTQIESSSPNKPHSDLLLTDWNSDGMLDLVLVHPYSEGEVMLNSIGARSVNGVTFSKVKLKPLDPADAQPCTDVISGTDGIVPIEFEVTAEDQIEIGEIRAMYSPNGGGKWYPAQSVARRGTTELSTNQTLTYCWDTLNSKFFGQSPNLVFRIEVYPSLKPERNGLPGPYRYSFASGQTMPFGVRGTQVRALGSDKQPLEGASIYRLSDGLLQGGRPIGPSTRPLTTDTHGYLKGRGTVALEDKLVALYPTDVISTHTPTRLYFSQDSLLPLTITGTQTQTLSLVITDTRRLADIGVLLDISHTVGSDLSATLVAPDGAETALFTTTRSLGNGLIAVTLDQEAAQPISRQNVTGTVRPATSLEPLVGRPLDGTWTLRLENRGQGASSIVNGWGLALKVSDLFYTSAAPTERGLAMKEVSAGGVQTLTVSAANPLIVFDLDVALEWDASNDSRYLPPLELDFKRASEFLYDWTNGQVALGRITVYHDAKRSVFPGRGDPWSEADVRIYATNRMRPSAAQGGIVSEPFTDTMKGPDTSTRNIYGPGQVIMGAVWNRFGDASGNLGEDWSRTLAHELGHYLLFLDDNYLGMDDGLLVTVDDCPGAMSDHYLDDYANGYGEFNTAVLDGKAKADCPKTLSWQRTGRSDWQTIETFYPALRGPAHGDKFEGPMSLPLDLTQVQFVSPVSKTTTLVAPVIDLKFEDRAATQTTNTRVFLFKDGDEWLVDLGRPKLDQVVAYGAEPGDRLCTFDLVLGRAGCADVRRDSSVRDLSKAPVTWKPRVSILPAGKDALEVRVAGVASNNLHVRLFPQDFAAGPAQDLKQVAESEYAATFTMTVPAYSGYVHIWQGPEPDGEHEIVTDYALGGRPKFGEDVLASTHGMSPDLAKMRASSLAKMRGSSIAKMRASSLAKMRASSIARMRASSLGKIRAYAAAMSSDGQVLLAGDELKFDDGEYVTLQAATAPEAIPSWATLVGQVYQISVSTPTIPITNASLSFGYLGGDVLAGQEEGLRIHFWNGVIWEELPTRLDTGNNYASAKLKGPGRYALLTSVEIPLQPGWNLVGYPVQTSGVDVALRRIDEVLRDIAGQYSVVYGYDACAPGGGWQVYSPGAPGWVSDLVAPDFGRGYWINVTAGEPITLHLRGEFSSGEVEATKPTATTACVERLSSAAIPAPPTTFYGNVLPDAGFSPAAGQEVVARVDGVPCGEGVTRQEGADVVYEVAVEAASSKRACGSADKLVTFRIGDRLIGSHPWTGNGLELLDLQPGHRAAGVEVQAPGCTKLLPNGDFELGLSWDASPVGDVTLTAGQGRRNTQGLRLSTAPGNTISIERELTLPDDARRLKLAFAFKRADGVEFAPDLTLFANGQPKWQQKSANSVWREASVDLTPYRGQRVRLKLEARGGQPRQSSAAILDDLDVLVCR